MGILKTTKVKIGMELAEPVINIHGKVLFKSGDIITEKHFKALKAWGVTEVCIKGKDGIDYSENDEKALDEIDENTRKTIEKEVDYLFQKTDKNNPVIMELYRQAIKNQLSEIMR